MGMVRAKRTGFYAIAGVAMIAIAVTGFWPQYYGRLGGAAPLEPVASHWLVHLHSTLFVGWLFIFVAQSLLIDTGRRALHRTLGPILAGYGYLAATIGVVAAVGLAARRVTLGGEVDDAAAFVIAPLLDMIMFAGFLTAAIRFRNRPEIHKRLMVLATYSFAFIGLVRFLGRNTDLLADVFWGTVAMAAPIAICAALDALLVRKLHMVWVWGLTAFVARLLIEYAGTTQTWLPIGKALIAPFV